jgi:hypothetical protein
LRALLAAVGRVAENSARWVDCPEAISANRFCDAPAEIIHRQVIQSTQGPIVHVRIRCALGHILLCPIAIFDQEAAL